MSKSKFLCLTAVTFLVTVAFSVTSWAQDHAVGVGKNCPEVSKVGDTATCTLRVSNEDEFGDTLTVDEFWDLVGNGTTSEFRNPATGNLPIIAVDAGVTCTAGAGPIGFVFPCEIPGIAQTGGSGLAVRVSSTFTIPSNFVPANPANPQLPDQANVIVRDGCDAQPVGCTEGPQQQQFGAAVSLFESSLDVTKTGPDTAKVGDTITYTIGFVDTSTALAPAFENCTGTDTVLGTLGAFTAGVNRTFDYTVQAGDPDPLPNTATITCDVVGFDNTASDSDNHSVDLIDPSIDVTKTGPASAKVGDTITYTIGFTDTGTGTLENCTGNDDVIGPLGAFTAGVPRNFNYTVQAGDPDPLVNVATITCDVAGFDNQASDNDTHSVDLIDPSIDVTKTGPAIAKRGDTITYTIGFTNTGSGTLENCTGTDTVLGTLGAFTAGVNRTFDYTVQAGDPDPLPNTATITCDVAGFDNTASDSDDHSVDLINPSVDLTKECTPDPVAVGGTINWAITVDNTGDIDLDCLVNDPTAGYTNEPVTVAAGGSEALAAGATVEAGDGPVISNTASVNCQIAGFDNSVSDSDTADCEVTVINELCRTPGFWKTHGGAEKAGRSTNLVWEVIDWTPGDTLGTICGVEIDNTSVNGYEDVPAIMTGNGDGSALEGMCVHPKTKIVRQLQRQLIAASLNCVASGGSADCTGISVYQDWMDANAACTTVANGGVADLSSFIDTIDAFNNGEAPFTCTENIGDSIVFEGVDYKVPGPAGSSNACSEATYNDFYLVPLP